VNRAEFQALADVRLAEARDLLALNPPRPDGAYYLAGYAVECALKACIARGYAQHDWPEKGFVAECHTHIILTLVKLAGLEPQRAVDANANHALGLNWLIVKDWSERSRYERHAWAKAQKMVDAVGDNANGVLTWIKAHW
jgi:hypothetical protein